MPDFTNLKNQWATLTPSGVALSAYSTSPSSTLPACPASTAGEWTVDPSAALPALGASGSAAASTSSPSATAGSASGSATGSSASASSTHKGAAFKLQNPISIMTGEGGILGTTIAALVVLGAGFVWWL